MPFSASLLAFLKSPASYPHRPAEVRSTETHISWVFFVSPFVYKVKKPVDLGFLDFSTLERRRHFCEREVQLNRRLCPDVYLGVTPIYQDTSGFSFEEKGGVVAEYSVNGNQPCYRAVASLLRLRKSHRGNRRMGTAAKNEDQHR